MILGTSKTFIVQQEAQKTYMIYILCSDSFSQSFEEKDSSFSVFFDCLNNLKENTEKERLDMIHIFIISRLLYLYLILEEANQRKIELDPVEFFILQMNNYSSFTAILFVNVQSLLRGNQNLIKICNDLIHMIHSKYPYVKEKGISFAIDQAGVLNNLFRNL